MTILPFFTENMLTWFKEAKNHDYVIYELSPIIAELCYLLDGTALLLPLLF